MNLDRATNDSLVKNGSAADNDGANFLSVDAEMKYSIPPLNDYFRRHLDKYIAFVNTKSFIWHNNKNRATEAIAVLKNIAESDEEYYKSALLEASAVSHAKEYATVDYLLYLYNNQNICPSSRELLTHKNKSSRYLNIQQARNENNIQAYLVETGLNFGDSIRKFEISYMGSVIMDEMLSAFVAELESMSDYSEKIRTFDIDMLISDIERAILFDNENFVINGIAWKS